MYLCNLNRNNYVVLIPIFILIMIIGMIQILFYSILYFTKIIISHLLNNKDVPFLTNKSMTKAILFFMMML